jgi:hypothetical protein
MTNSKTGKVGERRRVAAQRRPCVNQEPSRPGTPAACSPTSGRSPVPRRAAQADSIRPCGPILLRACNKTPDALVGWAFGPIGQR